MAELDEHNFESSAGDMTTSTADSLQVSRLVSTQRRKVGRIKIALD